MSLIVNTFGLTGYRGASSDEEWGSPVLEGLAPGTGVYVVLIALTVHPTTSAWEYGRQHNSNGHLSAATISLSPGTAPLSVVPDATDPALKGKARWAIGWLLMVACCAHRCILQ